MTSSQREDDPATSTDRRTARPWWIGAAAVTFAVLVVLRGLSQAGQLSDGPLHQWYVQLGICALAVAGYAALEQVVRRATR